ncbi:MAG TPA: hypothetical protein VIL74_04425 [Pyrinomonadaceae bacterium]|jgi:hypothetical protein
MTEKSANPFKPLGRGYPFYFLSIGISLLIIFTRRPDAFLNPQFWAEDGRVWYAEAYERGFLYSVTTPEAGYLQTISRLTASFSQLFPLDYAPLIFNAVAVFVKLLVAQFILSNRTTAFLPALWMRLFAAFIYLALPHSYETHANLTNAQWHLALLSCLIIIGAPASTRAGKIFDFAVIFISALSGPFCLLLLPVALIKYYRDGDKWLLTLTIVLAAGSLIQGFSLLSADRPSKAPLGANINLFLRILGGHLFFSSIFGETGFRWTTNRSVWKDGVAVIINLCGLALVVYALIKANFELRLLITFSALIVAAALVSPAITNEKTQWEFMRYPPVGSRYWLIPIFCFLLLLFWTWRAAEYKFLRRLAAGLLLLAPIGIILDWRYPPFQDFDFPKHAAEFNAAQSGSEVVIPINPNWEMRLRKK